MVALAASLFLLGARLAAPPAATGPNRVEICSVAAGDCASYAAVELDPSLRPQAAAGQLAFIDPVTGDKLAPTAEQHETLQLQLDEEQEKSAAQPTIETMRDGTTRARLGGAYAVYVTARLAPAAPAKTDAASQEKPSQERPQ
jgi:hypothetical protein